MVPGYGDEMLPINFVFVLTVAGGQNKRWEIDGLTRPRFLLVSEVANMWRPERRMKNYYKFYLK